MIQSQMRACHGNTILMLCFLLGWVAVLFLDLMCLLYRAKSMFKMHKTYHESLLQALHLREENARLRDRVHLLEDELRRFSTERGPAG